MTRSPRRHEARTPLDTATRHYLESGCWMGDGPAALEIFLLARRGLAGDPTELRRLWQVHRDDIKRLHPDETFAEVTMAGHAWPGGRLLCPDHPIKSPSRSGTNQ
jgi:hypothetical protein